jgi:hypothetical protein
MIIRSHISSFIIFVSILAVCSCKTSPKLTFKVSGLYTEIKPTKITISKLADDYKSYQGQYVETSGIFYWGFEEFAINTDKNLLTGETKQFWLGTDRGLNIDNASLDKMNGKRITIKGIIDTTKKGHLNSYLATISKIYFWEEQ